MAMTQILLATNNRGKLVEIQAILGGLPAVLVTPRQLGIQLEVEENASSYGENAALKATAFLQASGLLTLADDSGLEVYALKGQPGIRSARYAPVCWSNWRVSLAHGGRASAAPSLLPPRANRLPLPKAPARGR
jgi:non-canonical purine NTP pyrophosphatase (RdgB/HAM1 family)